MEETKEEWMSNVYKCIKNNLKTGKPERAHNQIKSLQFKAITRLNVIREYIIKGNY